VPEVAVYESVSWVGASPENTYTEKESWTMKELVEELASFILPRESGVLSTPAGELPKAEHVEANRTATEKREQLDETLLRYLHRDPADEELLRRWNQPEDVLNVYEELDSTDSRHLWVEAMTDKRRTELHGLLWTYFGKRDYMNEELVLEWRQVNGRWKPHAKIRVGLWIELEVEAKGSQLAGYASCAGTIRQKIRGRKK
jgi:hypothetical protein